MKRTLCGLLSALLAASPLRAQNRASGQASAGGAPVVPVTPQVAPVSPTLSTPVSLAPSADLSAPAPPAPAAGLEPVAASQVRQETALAAPTPKVGSPEFQEGLETIGQGHAELLEKGGDMSAEQAGGKAAAAFEGRGPSAGAVTGSLAVGVALAPALQYAPAGPIAYGAFRWLQERGAPRTERPKSDEAPPSAFQRVLHGVGTLIEVGAPALIPLIASAPMRYWIGDNWLLPLALGGLWALLAQAGIGALAKLRGSSVALWQASHDYKLRSDGEFLGGSRYVRAQPYFRELPNGSVVEGDKYTEHAPGPVGAGEKLVIRTLYATAGLLFLSGLGFWSAALYNAAFTAGNAWADFLDSRRKP